MPASTHSDLIREIRERQRRRSHIIGSHNIRPKQHQAAQIKTYTDLLNEQIIGKYPIKSIQPVKETRIVRNDYSQHFINTGVRPQNTIREPPLPSRYDEYPRLAQLTRLKDDNVARRATPSMSLRADLKTLDLNASLGGKFDVILVDPPLEEYSRVSAVAGSTNLSKTGQSSWSWPEIEALRIEDIAAPISFCFLWVGDAEGLDKGRQVLHRWGFRRSEDVAWIKTNRTSQGVQIVEPRGILQHTKEHCLMGIRGTVRRSTDGHLVHCNIDTDVIITEEPPFGSTAKPEEMYHLIEHFCLGRRRLELFGEDHNMRPGWVTVGSDLSISDFNPTKYWPQFDGPDGTLVGASQEVESLRPKSKSPPPSKRRNGRGGGMGGMS
ncbi:hypothetical protein SmJEL517_g01742 [Synchytrium microbalum]|uniref:MT-A70-domain-containing protein n=1 Tax=Synchytrium microbalum TaxID=1806994 RepID=A0A507CEB9_9FUNG|nr:uncharacterized protein SmJEL517_g01742 [Synchytrium microbalum]TPX35925.1 hypothetical protein SmJEL517_g01742 [Synchytrium microbalum]